ncbi:MAG TPA: hypothetical protein VNL91_07510 [Thermoanaerobaculia bacterium]|nr:hypothetical protein [Thermoanaerobaculia bacterium]
MLAARTTGKKDFWITGDRGKTWREIDTPWSSGDSFTRAEIIPSSGEAPAVQWSSDRSESRVVEWRDGEWVTLARNSDPRRGMAMIVDGQVVWLDSCYHVGNGGEASSEHRIGVTLFRGDQEQRLEVTLHRDPKEKLPEPRSHLVP